MYYNNDKKNEVVKTGSGNLLFKIQHNGTSVFIYTTPEGKFLPNKPKEVTDGQAITHMEWAWLNGKPEARRTKRDATETQIAMVQEAIVQREEFLKLPTMADRMEWVQNNVPQKETKVISITTVKPAEETTQKPFENLKDLLGFGKTGK